MEEREPSARVISGAAIRSLYVQKGRFREFFLLRLSSDGAGYELDDFSGGHVGKGFEPVAAKAYDFENVSTLDATPVYAEFHPTTLDLAEFAQWYFEGNRARDLVGGEGRPVEWVPTPTRMADDRFWDFIQVFGQIPSEQGADRLIRALVTAEVDVISEFSQTLAEKLSQLDRPDNMRRSDGTEPVVPMSPDVFLYYRCAVVAAGPTAFERMVEHPGIDQEALDGSAGEYLLTVAERAMEEKTGRQVVFVNSVNYETGSNREAWGGTAVPVLAVAASAGDSVESDAGQYEFDEEAAALIARLEMTVAALEAQLSPESREAMARSREWDALWTDGDGPDMTWFGARCLIAIEGGVDESVMFFGVPGAFSGDGASLARAVGRAHSLARQRADELQGEFHGHVEVMRSQYAHPMNGAMVFEIDRKAAPDVEAYAARYFHTSSS